VDAEDLMFADVVTTVTRTFHLEAERRKLDFEVEIDPSLPRRIVTDSKRLLQVLKNLLSNAFKFTAHGGVRLRVAAAVGGWTREHPILGPADTVVSFEVTDTGIGIPAEKARSSSSRRFSRPMQVPAANTAGTGLGLAISRELAGLLGGEIVLQSTPGSGSTFTLYLPLSYVGPLDHPGTSAARSIDATDAFARPAFPAVRRAEPALVAIPDDRDQLEANDHVMLIVEDDPSYARVIVDLARSNGFKVLVAGTGTDALDLVRQYRPTAVSLDVFLPDMLGWTVLSHLKRDAATRHIPVQIVTLDEDRQHGLARGAFSYVGKPTSADGLNVALSRIKAFASPRRKRLLVVDDNAGELESITALLAHDDIDITTAGTGTAALIALREQPYDCVVLDLRLPDMSGFEVLEAIREEVSLRDLPVVVFTGKELSAEEDARLRMIARSVVVKGVESPDRLLDETALFLHRVVADLAPRQKRKMLERLHGSDEDLIGKQVLVVDDDVRNIFALSSVLERRGMNVLDRQHRPRGDCDTGGHTGRGHRADGHHDAGDGRLRNDARDSPGAGVWTAADHRADREGDDGRPRQVFAGGRLRLSGETRQHRTAGLGPADVAASLGAP